MTSKDDLHQQIVDLEGQGANWQRLMVVHALVELGLVTAIECTMPRCILPTREFIYTDGRRGVLSLDHALPLSQGGDHRPENIRLAHLACNSAAAGAQDLSKYDPAEAFRLTRRRQAYAKRVARLAEAAESSVNETIAVDALLDEACAGAWDWLSSTKRLQREVYGFDYSFLKGEPLVDYLIWNHSALIVELSEFLGEVQWKNWMADRGKVNREEAVGELVDVGHFLGNLLCALGVTDEEWEFRYREKQKRNAARQRKPGGYTLADKCPSCRRELDAPDAIYMRSGFGAGAVNSFFCSHCNTRLNDPMTKQVPDCPTCERSLNDPEVRCVVEVDYQFCASTQTESSTNGASL